ncbi:MAG: methyltransferase [Pseudonocardiales bacterium]|nr:methyltransferase [Pseudonocardiales bacterium]
MNPDRPSALLDGPGIERLRAALAGYTADAIHDLLGIAGTAALRRGDLAALRRHLTADTPVSTLVRLFLLGEPVDETAAARALHPLTTDAACAAGLLAVSAGAARAVLDIRPYAEAVPGLPGLPAAAAPPWWVVSDFGTDVRPGPLAADHVLGIGTAALTLAQATIRSPVAAALDLGTGCGVQALHLSRHAGAVTATDISHRALRMAATTAALSGASWDLRAGSLLAPVRGQVFDLIVANPPFVVSPGLRAGDGGYDYRDGGLAGDELCRRLVGALPGALAPGGVAQLLANWIIPTEAPWAERLHEWLAGGGCDVWVWQREVAEPAEYVALWLRDAGELPGTAAYARRYDAWLDWMTAAGIAGIGMGLITLWRTDSAVPAIVCEDIPQALEQPAGAYLPAWHARRRWLGEITDDDLLNSLLRTADGVVRTRQDLRADTGWQTVASTLRQSHGMRWEVDVDEAIAALLAGCDGRHRLHELVAVLAASLGATSDDVTAAAIPVLRDLVGRGFLEPAASG